MRQWIDDERRGLDEELCGWTCVTHALHLALAAGLRTLELAGFGGRGADELLGWMVDCGPALEGVKLVRWEGGGA